MSTDSTHLQTGCWFLSMAVGGLPPMQAPGSMPMADRSSSSLHERNNDRLVDCFARFLCQALTTAELLPAAAEVDADYEPHADARELALAEREEEEENRREPEGEMSCWTDYADACARSEDEGWFYDDDD